MKKSTLALKLATIRTLTTEQLTRIGGGGLVVAPITNLAPTVVCVTGATVATITALCAITTNGTLTINPGPF